MNDAITQCYRPIDRAIDKMKLGFSHLLFVRGGPGIGKSYQIGRCLRDIQLPFVEVNGDTSDAYLYRILYENNGKVIWFKDVVRLLKSLRSLDLLKSACETTEKRTITNLNYSDKQTDLPKSFAFTGRLVFDFKSLAGLKFREDFEALASRGDFVDLVFSHSEICSIMRQICASGWQREVTEFLIDHHQLTEWNALNLRSQHKAFRCYQYARTKSLDWRHEIREELQNQCSSVQKLLYPILGDGPRRALEVKKYLLRSGFVSTIRTADRRISEWIELGDVFRVSEEGRNFLISLAPIFLSQPEELDQDTGDTADTRERWENGLITHRPLSSIHPMPPPSSGIGGDSK